MTRLDVWLAEHGLAESREKAQASIAFSSRLSMSPRRATSSMSGGSRRSERLLLPADEGESVRRANSSITSSRRVSCSELKKAGAVAFRTSIRSDDVP